MFYNAKPRVFEKAKIPRENMTASEQKLWQQLKGKKMLNLRFRPQHPVDKFIADFYCHPLKLIIEVDGGIHKSKDQKDYDLNREVELNFWGIKVIRFTNDEVDQNMNLIITQIQSICLERRTELKSPLQGI